MTTTAILKAPVNGKCLPVTWYKNRVYSDFSTQSQICPDYLCIGALFQAGKIIRSMVNFNGRGWANAASCGTDTYVLAFPTSTPGLIEEGSGSPLVDPNSQLLIDVWGAYRAGVWTSSVTIQIALTTNAATTTTVHAQPVNDQSLRVSKAAVSPQIGALLCSTIVVATVTVNDDGTFSIA